MKIANNNILNVEKEIKKEIKLFLKNIKEETQCSMMGLGKIYSNFFSIILWVITFLLFSIGICFFIFYGFYLVPIINSYICLSISIGCLIIGFILLTFLLIARKLFYKIFNNLFQFKLKQFNLFIYIINNTNKYGYFELKARKQEPIISEADSKNAIIVNDLIEIDMLSWRNVVIGEILNNSFNFVIFNWKIKGININKIETSAVIEIFTPFFSHHKIDITNTRRQSNDFLIKLGDVEFNDKFFIYSEFDDPDEEEGIYKEVKEIFNERTIKKWLSLEKNGFINNDFRLVIENGKIYFTFEKCEFSFLDLEIKKYNNSVMLTKIKLNKSIPNDLEKFYKIIELIFSLPLFGDRNYF